MSGSILDGFKSEVEYTLPNKVKITISSLDIFDLVDVQVEAKSVALNSNDDKRKFYKKVAKLCVTKNGKPFLTDEECDGLARMGTALIDITQICMGLSGNSSDAMKNAKKKSKSRKSKS